MSVQSSRRISHDHFTRPSQDNPTFQKQPASKQKAHQAYQTDIMGTYARIAVAKQHIAKKIDQRSDKGHYMMAKQVSHEYTPATSHLFSASVPQDAIEALQGTSNRAKLCTHATIRSGLGRFGR
jgi:hypothetical protein